MDMPTNNQVSPSLKKTIKALAFTREGNNCNDKVGFLWTRNDGIVTLTKRLQGIFFNYIISF